MDGVTKEVKSYRTLDHMRPTYGYPWYLIHRVDLHNELKRLAFDKDGAGIPAVLKTGHCVISLVRLPAIFKYIYIQMSPH